MNTDQGTELLYAKETHQIIGCAFEVLNTIGHGLHEKVYENALVVEFKLKNIPTQQQPSYPVSYKGIKVGEFIPDLITFERVVIDTKVINQITEHETGKMINYLKITKNKVGLIINFKRAKLEWTRVVL